MPDPQTGTFGNWWSGIQNRFNQLPSLSGLAQQSQQQNPYQRGMSLGQYINASGGIDKLASQVPGFGPSDLGAFGAGTLRLIPKTASSVDPFTASLPEGVRLRWGMPRKTYHHFDLFHEESGKHVGEMLATHDPSINELYVEHLYSHAGGDRPFDQNYLFGIGPREIRSLIPELRFHFPGLQTIRAYRASGARHGPATIGQTSANAKDTVLRLPPEKPE